MGNPLFFWGNRISTFLGDGYRDWLISTNEGSHGNADLVSYFLRRGFLLARERGCLGFITTNTVAESDTRASGLDYIVSQGGTIYQAVRDEEWDGQASVRISKVFVYKGKYLKTKILNSQPVSEISTNLYAAISTWQAQKLIENADKSFKGVDFGGKGFLITVEEKESIIKRFPDESQYIWSVVNAATLTSCPNLI